MKSQTEKSERICFNDLGDEAKIENEYLWVTWLTISVDLR